ncbi:uncharacterized protein [Ptychodera flava]|uniref:uncharacterized protein n=1 Tax=Ptychodera flava TaxID=63121 RepID=UPI00396A124A
MLTCVVSASSNTYRGTFIGLVFGFALGVFISAGQVVAEQLNVEPLPIQRISFIWYPGVNFFTTLVVGVVTSEIANCIKPSLIKPVDPVLLAVFLRPKHPKSEAGNGIKEDKIPLKEEGSDMDGNSDKLD